MQNAGALNVLGERCLYVIQKLIQPFKVADRRIDRPSSTAFTLMQMKCMDSRQYRTCGRQTYVVKSFRFKYQERKMLKTTNCGKSHAWPPSFHCSCQKEETSNPKLACWLLPARFSCRSWFSTWHHESSCTQKNKPRETNRITIEQESLQHDRNIPKLVEPFFYEKDILARLKLHAHVLRSQLRSRICSYHSADIEWKPSWERAQGLAFLFVFLTERQVDTPAKLSNQSALLSTGNNELTWKYKRTNQWYWPCLAFCHIQSTEWGYQRC